MPLAHRRPLECRRRRRDRRRPQGRQDLARPRPRRLRRDGHRGARPLPRAAARTRPPLRRRGRPRRPACAARRYRPRLLLLDPLVRLHRIDENSAGEMSALLGELRALQRAYQLALVLVHHLRKYAGARGADGQALRGSGDLHAWGDSNLYLRRRDRQLVLTIEHRAAPAPPPCRLELATDPVPHLRVVDAESAADPQAAAGVADQILTALAAAPVPLSRDDLRAALRTRNATLGDALIRLRAEGRIERCPGGFRLRPPAPSAIPVPPPTAQRERNTAS